MDPTTKKLISLLGSSDLSLRTAVIRVLAEIGQSSKPVIREIGKCLREPFEDLQLAALEALARLGASDVAHMVVPLILSPGALREQAMAVISAIGPSVAPQLQKLYPEADFHGKRAVTTALARVGGKSALRFLLKTLPDEPFELQKHLTISVCDGLDRMQPTQQASVFNEVVKLLKSKEAAKRPPIRITAIVMLGHFRGQSLASKACKLLESFTDKKYAPELRRYALVSLNRLIPEVKVSRDLINHLMRLLCDDDWHNIVQHALHAFQRLHLSPQTLTRLVDLLRRSPHFSVHIHILERLQEVNNPETAQAIIPFLADSRFRVREAAEAALRRVPTAIESLFQVLMKSDDLEVTQRVNSILRDFPQETRQKYVDRAAARLMTLFERNDPHYRSFLEFVRAVDAEPLRKRIYQRSKSLKAGRSRDKWARICAYLQLLWDHHLITAEGRYLFAVALIRQSPKDLAPAARRADLGLRVIRALIYDDLDALVKKLQRDKDLKPEDYFFLGFHFSEEGPEVQPFGLAMLQFVARKYAKSRVAGPAKHKLELQRSEEEAGEAVSAADGSADKAKRSAGSRRQPARAAAPLRHSASKSAARTARKSTGKSKAAAPPRKPAAKNKAEKKSRGSGKPAPTRSTAKPKPAKKSKKSTAGKQTKKSSRPASTRKSTRKPAKKKKSDRKGSAKSSRRK